MTDEPIRYLSADDLKARLPLEYLCDRLGVLLNGDGQALCPLPGHEHDSDPSFYVWDGDDGKRRWACQPCGEWGDQIDLIRKVRGCGFAEALTVGDRIANELPADWAPAALEVVAWEDDGAVRGAMAAEVDGARARAAEPRYADGGWLAGFGVRYVAVRSDDDLELARAWHAHLRDAWGWGIDAQMFTLMPHWGYDGQLSGAKGRGERGGDKIRFSLDGSRYEALYGCWLGQRWQSVLVAEGETDAGWASFAAARGAVKVDVRALPRGAGSPPTDAMLQELRQWRTVFLAFDPDDAGQRATEAYVEALHAAGARDVRICLLPLGRDLRSAQIDLAELLRHATKPAPPPTGVVAEPGGYARVKQDGEGNERHEPVTTWTMRPVAQLVGDDENRGFQVAIREKNQDRPGEDSIRLADMRSSQALNGWANRRGMVFTGSDVDRARIADLMYAKGSVTPLVHQVDRVGWHPEPAGHLGAGPTYAYPDGSHIGLIPRRYVPTAHVLDLSDRATPPDGPFDLRDLEAFLDLGPRSVTEPLLAWVVAAARRPLWRQFPLLFLSGSSGSGKSTLAREAMRLAGSDVEYKLESVTPFVMLKAVSSTTSLPVFLDEWTLTVKPDVRGAFQSNVPNLYDGGRAERGQADLSTVVYHMTAPVVVAGEDTFQLDRENDRMVTLYPTRAQDGGAALRRVQGVRTENFARRLHRFVVEEHRLLADPRALPPSPDRPTHNRLVLEQGWRDLSSMLRHAAEHGDRVPDLPDRPDLSCFAVAAEERGENVYEVALQLGAAYHDRNRLPLVWRDPEGRGTWFRPQELIREVRDRTEDVRFPGGSRAMTNYFRERHGELRQERVTPPGSVGTTVRAMLIRGYDLGGEPDGREGWTPS